MIINQIEQYEELKERMNRELHVWTPIFRDVYLHPAINKMLCIGITFINGDTYLVSISHKDAPNFPLPEANELTYTTSKNIEGHDAKLLAYLHNKNLPEVKDFYTEFVHNAHNYFDKASDLNRIVPIAVWSKIIKQYHARVILIIQEHHTVTSTASFSQTQAAIETLKEIEKSGLYVELETFNDHFNRVAIRSVQNNLVYSEYNPYTTTGRPSNKYNHINFAALPKNDGTRSVFTSRFPNGWLVQFDFDAYHLRLLGEYTNVPLPTTPLHEYLAKLYFSKDTITEEEYDVSKQNTFNILYGSDVHTNIELLQNIKKVSKQLFKEYQQTNEYILSPLFKRKIFISEQNATENKVFNYFVQSLEFERTVGKLKTILKYLYNKQSKLVLYTYDAVLLDVPEDELEIIKQSVRNILDHDGFPVKMYIGKNYEVMEKI